MPPEKTRLVRRKAKPAPAKATVKASKPAAAGKTKAAKASAKAPASKKSPPRKEKEAPKKVSSTASKASKATRPAKAAAPSKATRPATKAAPAKAAPAKAAPSKAAAAKAPPAKAAPPKAPPPGKAVKVGKKEKAHTGGKAAAQKAEAAPPPPAPPAVRPRATKLPPVGDPVNKRELEQLLTAGQGRGVSGEGSLKGRLVVKDGFPYLHVVGRDKRELVFLLLGPDQEVLPAYVDHRVSVSGLIRKTHNHGGTVDVRKWSAKKPGSEAAPAPAEQEQKLRFLSPGEVEQASTGGMGAGLIGFARIRGNLEMSGDDFFLVVSGAGTRQQVSFLLQGKATKGLKKHVGHTVQVTGVVEKSSGWGGSLQVEGWELRQSEMRLASRDNMKVTHVEGLENEMKTVEVGLNQGLTVRLTEEAGYTWAIEPTSAKRVGLREANFEPGRGEVGPTREFFFTPRNPGTFEVEFFLAKVFNPGQVSRSCKLQVNVKSQA